VTTIYYYGQSEAFAEAENRKILNLFKFFLRRITEHLKCLDNSPLRVLEMNALCFKVGQKRSAGLFYRRIPVGLCQFSGLRP